MIKIVYKIGMYLLPVMFFLLLLAGCESPTFKSTIEKENIKSSIPHDSSKISLQSYEIKFYKSTAYGWYGGDDRPDFGPRDIGNAQSVYIDKNIVLDSFAFCFRQSFDYDYLPDYNGHQVTLILDIRNSVGTILQTKSVIVPNTFSGGWITWSGLNRIVSSGTTLIFSSYLVGAYTTNQYTSSLVCDINAGYSKGIRYVKSGTGDSDMKSWSGWYIHEWDSCFWLKGRLR